MTTTASTNRCAGRHHRCNGTIWPRTTRFTPVSGAPSPFNVASGDVPATLPRSAPATWR